MTYLGLRPGEKLYEEKLMAEEGMKKTDNDLIHIGKPIPFDISKFLGQLTELAQASYENSPHIVEMENLLKLKSCKTAVIHMIHLLCKKLLCWFAELFLRKATI